MTRKKILIGNRIPGKYFITSGCGESDNQIHAGSFDLALRDARIENFNIIKYSSILPENSSLVEMPASYVHGSVAETIMAVSSTESGERVTAGLIIGRIFDRSLGRVTGGLVAEHRSSRNEQDARENLSACMDEMFTSRYGNNKNLELVDKQVIIRSFVPKKKFGTAIVAIVFVDYEVPVVESE